MTGPLVSFISQAWPLSLCDPGLNFPERFRLTPQSCPIREGAILTCSVQNHPEGGAQASATCSSCAPPPWTRSLLLWLVQVPRGRLWEGGSLSQDYAFWLEAAFIHSKQTEARPALRRRSPHIFACIVCVCHSSLSRWDPCILSLSDTNAEFFFFHYEAFFLFFKLLFYIGV